jgi:hypothetical protein
LRGFADGGVRVLGDHALGDLQVALEAIALCTRVMTSSARPGPVDQCIRAGAAESARACARWTSSGVRGPNCRRSRVRTPRVRLCRA